MLLPQLTIDITTTKACNFACSYCFEAGYHENKHMDIETFDKIIDFMKKNNFSYNLMIMGGEPSIAPFLNYFFDRLKLEIQKGNIVLTPLNKGGSSVYITNGYNIENIFNQLNDINFWGKFMKIQISYDGKVIQDKYRKTIGGKLTSEIVLENFKEIRKYFQTQMKSTLNIYDFDLLEQVVLEFKELNQKYNIVYNVTENKDSFFISKDEIKNYIENYFTKVIKIEHDYYKKTNKFCTRWLIDSSLTLTKCSAGVMMFHISPDEIVSPCHLSLYSKNKFEYGKIDENFFEKFNNYKKYFEGVKEDKCKNCNAIFCLRCPMYKYDLDQNLNELYNGIDEKVCFYYQEISKYIFYLKRKLNLI